MNSSITPILFYFTFLFSTSSTFISKESNITIDLSNKMGVIEYINLETPKETINYAVTNLKKMNTITEFDEYNDDNLLKLISKKIYLNKKKLNATIEFSFEDINESMNTLSFYRLPDGNFAHPISESEKVISSNGKIIKKEDLNYVLWNKETKMIKLKMKHLKPKENFLLDMVSLQNYWKE